MPRRIRRLQWRLSGPHADLYGNNGKQIGTHFAGTTYIQRINTAGGRAPAAGCTPETVGDTAEIPYTADYAFWKSRGA